MITFFELYYSDKIPARLIKLREKYRLTQSDVGNSSQVSQIEKGKRPITNTILYDLKERTGLDYADVIFGNLNEFIEELFYHCFSTILYKDFSIERYNKVYKFQSREYVEIQEICLRLAKTFANFNIQRKNFNEDSEELEMDTFHKKDDINIMMGDKGFNPARSLRESSINEETVIDFEEMFNILWLMLEDKLVQSFKVNVCNSLFELDKDDFPDNFSLDKIDFLINKWWSNNISSEIIPNLIKKLKENPLFNIGYMVDEILTKMYRGDIPNSLLNSVPLRISKEYGTNFGLTLVGGQQSQKLDPVKINQVYKDYMELISQGKEISELYQKYSKEDLTRLGVSIYESQPINKIEERTFDEILNLVTNPYSTRKIQNYDFVEIEQTRFTPEDKARVEAGIQKDMTDIEIMNHAELYDLNLDNKSVTRKIEGLLTNNTQVTYYFQEKLNEELLAMANALDNVQQAFIRLLDEEEVKNFSL